VLLRDALCSSGAETLDHIYAQPTMLTVYGERRRFKSPEYLAQIVNRFFGNKVERLILELRAWAGERSEPFWADSTKESHEMYAAGIVLFFHTNSTIAILFLISRTVMIHPSSFSRRTENCMQKRRHGIKRGRIR